MRLAVFSDVHGNIQGLTAVLADIEAHGVDLVWCGGDLVGYGANPGDVIEAIRQRGIPTIMGNYDNAIGYFRMACGCDYADEDAMNRGLRSVAWTKEHTSEAHKAFLRNLPYRLHRTIEGREVVLVHGSPASLTEYLFEDVPQQVLAGHLAATGAHVLICCHTHKPYHRRVGASHVINAGSAGKPKHGNPNATYVILDISANDVTSEIVEVPYDYEAAVRAIEATDLPHEFAAMLRTGRG